MEMQLKTLNINDNTLSQDVFSDKPAFEFRAAGFARYLFFIRTLRLALFSAKPTSKNVCIDSGAILDFG